MRTEKKESANSNFITRFFFLIRNDAALRHEGHFKLKLKKKNRFYVYVPPRQKKKKETKEKL